MTNGRRNQRTPYPTKLPGIPKPPAEASPALNRYLTNLSEALEIRLGRKGDVRDRAITLRELIESGLAVDLANNPYNPNNPGSDFGGNDPNSGDIETPTAPTGFNATAGFSNVGLFWDYPQSQYRGHSFTEIWRNGSDNLTTATFIGLSPGMAYTDVISSVTSPTTFYYWARHVNINSVKGPFHANSGLAATLAANPAFLLAILTDEITSSQLVLTLREPIERIPDIETYIGYQSSYTGSSLLNRIIGSESDVAGIYSVLPKDSNGNIINVPSAAAFNTVSASVTANGNNIATNASNVSAIAVTIPTNAAGDYLSLASASALSALDGIVTSQGGTLTANSSAITAVQAVLPTDASGNFLTTASATALSTLDGTVTSQGGTIAANTSAITAVEAVLPTDANGNLVNTATASGLSTLTATVNNGATGVVATATRVDTLQTEVFNANGTARLASLAVTGNIESDLDKVEAQYTVKISQDQPNGNTYVTGYGLATTDVDGTPSSAFVVAADKFAVINPSTYQGGMDTTPTSVPFVVQSQSTTLLDSGEQVTVPAGVYMKEAFMSKATVLELIAGSVTADFVLASTFIRAPAIHGGTFNIGSFSANGSSDPTNWTVTGNNRQSNFSVDANGIMHCESAELKGITVKASDDTILLDAGGLYSPEGNNNLYNGSFNNGADGWSTSGSTSINTTLGRAYTNSNGYIQSTTKIPVSPQETLYVYADMYGANAYCTILFVKADGSFASSTVITSGWSPSAGTSQQFRVAKVDYPSYTGNPYLYALARFGTSSGGSTTTWHQVGVSKAPPVIDPAYASTYIRDLSVDTLQIAGNAVSVPLGDSDDPNSAFTANQMFVNTYSTFVNRPYNATNSWKDGVDVGPITWDNSNVNTRPEAVTVIANAVIEGTGGSTDFSSRMMQILVANNAAFTSNVARFGGTDAFTAQENRQMDDTSLMLNVTQTLSSLGMSSPLYFKVQVSNTDSNASPHGKLRNNGITVLASKK